jgi:hypothetical protein
MNVSSSTGDASANEEAYETFRARVAARFASNVGGGAPLFTTDAEGLFEAYLGALPESFRHSCSSCRRFFDRHGGLVLIGEDGRARSPVWSVEDVPEPYQAAVEAVLHRVRRAAVTGVFRATEPVWGTPETPFSAKWGRAWTHLAVTPPPSMIHASGLLTAGQAMAEKREAYATVARALEAFSRPLVEQALTILRAEALYRSEKVLGQAEWLAKLHADREGLAGPARDNVLWRAVATAPAGFCHPRASMIGTLLADLAEGLPFDEVARRFADKMHPLQYQRPQAAPRAGTIAQAEQIVATLNAAGALARRFARVDELEALWRPSSTVPSSTTPSSGGVFAHLRPREAPAAGGVQLPPTTITWVKFRDTVLPTAEAIAFHARAKADSYTALVTAANPDAPPILQWDRPSRRNPVSWYFWHGGSMPEAFGLRSNTWIPVTAVTLKPSQWGDEPLAHHGEFALFVLEGAKDTRTSGAALFPEFLRSEFHGVRSVLEAYSRTAKIEGIEQSSACGIALQKGSTWDQRFHVTTRSGTREYVLDRWD